MYFDGVIRPVFTVIISFNFSHSCFNRIIEYLKNCQKSIFRATVGYGHHRVNGLYILVPFEFFFTIIIGFCIAFISLIIFYIFVFRVILRSVAFRFFIPIILIFINFILITGIFPRRCILITEFSKSIIPILDLFIKTTVTGTVLLTYYCNTLFYPDTSHHLPLLWQSLCHTHRRSTRFLLQNLRPLYYLPFL